MVGVGSETAEVGEVLVTEVEEEVLVTAEAEEVSVEAEAGLVIEGVVGVDSVTVEVGAAGIEVAVGEEVGAGSGEAEAVDSITVLEAATTAMEVDLATRGTHSVMHPLRIKRSHSTIS